MDINLLPWREQLREEKKRDFLVILGIASALTLGLVIMIHLFIASEVKIEQRKSVYLQHEITILDQKIKEIQRLKRQKAALIARMQVIQALQANRTQVVHLFDELINILPDGIYLDRVNRNGDEVDLIGKAESNTTVSNLMRRIQKSEWLMEPLLNEIKSKDARSEVDRDFRLRLMHKRLVPVDAELPNSGGAL